MLHHGEVLSRGDLLRDVWDRDFDTSTNVVDVYVRYLRSKIDDPFDQKLIHTIVGQGYKFGDR
jgi:DNA-binding response OmpR family regulator